MIKISKCALIFFIFSIVNLYPSLGNSGWFGIFDKSVKQKIEDVPLKEFLDFYNTKVANNKASSKYRDLFTSAYKLLIDNYVYEIPVTKRKDLLNEAKVKILEKEKFAINNKSIITAKDITDTALYSLYSGLDPHTIWLNQEDSKKFQSDIEGEYKGIGVLLGIKKSSKYIEILDVIHNSPAYKAGLVKGDLFYRINNSFYDSKHLKEAVEFIKSKYKNTLQLKVLRSKKIKEFTIKVEPFIIESVYGKVIDNKYSYIKISIFNTNTTAEFRKVINKLNINNSKGIILDLRDNPGGVLYSSLIISDMFLSKSLILSVKGRDNSINSNYYATSNSFIKESVPLVILTNTSTASAAEIVSAALQQNHRAVIMGNQTFGKGSVQTLYNLKDGSSAKITIQLFYTPNGDALQGYGVVPNILIESNVKNTLNIIAGENSLNNKIKVQHLKQISKPDFTISENQCSVYKNVKDKKISCAMDYFRGLLSNNNK